MHSKGRALTSANRYINFSRFSQLPFLYQTGTLECYFNSTKVYNTALSRQNIRRDICFTRQLRGRANRSKFKEAIPFELPFDRNNSQPHTHSYLSGPEDSENASPSASHVQGSTITTSERAIFDRIYKDISQSAPKQTEEREFNHELENYEENGPLQDIEEIFESAIRQLEEPNQNGKGSELSSNTKSHDRPREALDNLFGTVQYYNRDLKSPGVSSLVASETKSIEAEPIDTYEAARRKHKIQVMAMLHKAQTDIEVWKVLEAEVFSLAHTLESHSKEENSLPSRKKKRQKSKSRERKDTVVPSNPPAASAPPSDSQLSILQNNFGAYCLEALRLLRRNFPTSPYALQVLPAIKRLGSIAYVLGATPSLYNELIFLKWTRYTDLHGIADLLQEMCNQGVEANEVTLEILKALSRERQTKLAAIKDGVLQPTDYKGFKYESIGVWWTMRAVQEAWQRILPMFTRIKMEHRQRLFGMDAEGEQGESIVKE